MRVARCLLHSSIIDCATQGIDLIDQPFVLYHFIKDACGDLFNVVKVAVKASTRIFKQDRSLAAIVAFHSQWQVLIHCAAYTVCYNNNRFNSRLQQAVRAISGRQYSKGAAIEYKGRESLLRQFF
ncbi:hypothetical protein D3C72_1924660 [compost metagenome]